MGLRWAGFGWVVRSMVMLLGAVLIGFGVKEIVTTQQFLANAATADGVVVSIDRVEEDDDDGKDTFYYPVVRFVTAGGQVVQYRDNLGETRRDTALAIRCGFCTIRRTHSRLGWIPGRIGGSAP